MTHEVQILIGMRQSSMAPPHFILLVGMVKQPRLILRDYLTSELWRDEQNHDWLSYHEEASALYSGPF